MPLALELAASEGSIAPSPVSSWDTLAHCGAAKQNYASAGCFLAFMNELDSIKVLIVNEHGQYLAGSAMHWDFTEDRTRARVFDYGKDRVPEQLQLVRKVYGTVWIAVKLDPSETYEFCDRCGTRMTAVNAVFDGRSFLCRDCGTGALALTGQ